MLRTQLWHGDLTIPGMQAAYKSVSGSWAVWPDRLRAECQWLLEQIDAELMMRELDHGVTA